MAGAARARGDSRPRLWGWARGAPQRHRNHLHNYEKLSVRLAPPRRRFGKPEQAVAHDVVRFPRSVKLVHRHNLAKCRAGRRLAAQPWVIWPAAHAERRGRVVAPCVGGYYAGLRTWERSTGIGRLGFRGGRVGRGPLQARVDCRHCCCLLAYASDELHLVEEAREQPSRDAKQGHSYPREPVPLAHECRLNRRHLVNAERRGAG